MFTGETLLHYLIAMEDDWVVDTLVGFLQSDTWKVPVSKFIEEKCIGKQPAASLVAANSSVVTIKCYCICSI